MSALVLDSSVAISLLLKDEYSSMAVRAVAPIRGLESRFVPGHFWIEISNALLMAERRGRASRAEITVALRNAFALPVITDDETTQRCEDTTIGLAREHSLTMYDAAYLELAIRRQSAFATIDKALVRAAAKVGVPLLT